MITMLNSYNSRLSITEHTGAIQMKIRDKDFDPKAYKQHRLHMLVAQCSITQSEANQLWRDYLRLHKQTNGK